MNRSPHAHGRLADCCQNPGAGKEGSESNRFLFLFASPAWLFPLHGKPTLSQKSFALHLPNVLPNLPTGTWATSMSIIFLKQVTHKNEKCEMKKNRGDRMLRERRLKSCNR
jgi:hypothetical protein